MSQDKTDQRATFSTYINSIAKTTYSLAWPSATYRSWSLEGIRPIDHGVEVTFQLLGTSYFGGDLWLNLAMDFSNGQFQQFRIVSHNAQLMEPFATSKLVAGATAYFASQYAAQTSPRAQAQSPPVTTTPQQPAPAPEPAPSSPQALAGPQETERVEAICISNSTDSVVSFAYSVGQWKEVSINPGYSIVITVKTPASENAVGAIGVSYLDGPKRNSPERNYNLRAGPVPSSPECKDAPNYSFLFQKKSLLIFSGHL